MADSNVAFRLGRTPRTFDPRIPHLSAILAGKPPPPPPLSVDWTANMPKAFGMMLNDTLGDCTCAAVYHARQVWSFNASGKEITEPDADVRQLYIQACGYNPKTPGEGPGGNEQHVLKYLLRTGMPAGPAGQSRDKISAFVEVDPRNLDDVRRTIADCGVAYIGFNVPQSIMPPGGAPPAVWVVDHAHSQIVGGHAVVLPGYDSVGPKVISWGQLYTMTWEFFATYVDEVYAIADDAWIGAKATTPGGLSLAELEAQMAALKEAAPPAAQKTARARPAAARKAALRKAAVHKAKRARPAPRAQRGKGKRKR